MKQHDAAHMPTLFDIARKLAGGVQQTSSGIACIAGKMERAGKLLGQTLPFNLSIISQS